MYVNSSTCSQTFEWRQQSSLSFAIKNSKPAVTAGDGFLKLYIKVCGQLRKGRIILFDVLSLVINAKIK